MSTTNDTKQQQEMVLTSTERPDQIASKSDSALDNSLSSKDSQPTAGAHPRSSPAVATEAGSASASGSTSAVGTPAPSPSPGRSGENSPVPNQREEDIGSGGYVMPDGSMLSVDVGSTGQYDQSSDELVQPGSDDAGSNSNLIVNYIPNALSDEGMRALFSPHGRILHCKIVRDHHTGLSLGYGFVKYSTHDGARRAINALNGFRLANKSLKVSIARPSASVPPKTVLFVTGFPSGFPVEEMHRICSSFDRVVQLLPEGPAPDADSATCSLQVQFSSSQGAARALHGFNSSPMFDPRTRMVFTLSAQLVESAPNAFAGASSPSHSMSPYGISSRGRAQHQQQQQQQQQHMQSPQYPHHHQHQLPHFATFSPPSAQGFPGSPAMNAQQLALDSLSPHLGSYDAAAHAFFAPGSPPTGPRMSEPFAAGAGQTHRSVRENTQTGLLPHQQQHSQEQYPQYQQFQQLRGNKPTAAADSSYGMAQAGDRHPSLMPKSAQAGLEEAQGLGSSERLQSGSPLDDSAAAWHYAQAQQLRYKPLFSFGDAAAIWSEDAQSPAPSDDTDGAAIQHPHSSRDTSPTGEDAGRTATSGKTRPAVVAMNAAPKNGPVAMVPMSQVVQQMHSGLDYSRQGLMLLKQQHEHKGETGAEKQQEQMMRLHASHMTTHQMQPQQQLQAHDTDSDQQRDDEQFFSGVCLFVYHLPSEMREADMAALFAQYGRVLHAKVMLDLSTGRSKGFGFVNMGTTAEAQAAINNLDGFRIGRKVLSVSFKTAGPGHRSNHNARARRGPGGIRSNHATAQFNPHFSHHGQVHHPQQYQYQQQHLQPQQLHQHQHHQHQHQHHQQQQHHHPHHQHLQHQHQQHQQHQHLEHQHQQQRTGYQYQTHELQEHYPQSEYGYATQGDLGMSSLNLGP